MGFPKKGLKNSLAYQADLIKPRIAILVDGLSTPQWMQLKPCLQALPNLPYLTLVKLLTPLPERFYQLPETNSREEQARQVAQSVLLKVEQLLEIPAFYGIVYTSRLSAWLHQKEQEHNLLILGSKIHGSLRFKYPNNWVDINQWLAIFERLERAQENQRFIYSMPPFNS